MRPKLWSWSGVETLVMGFQGEIRRLPFVEAGADTPVDGPGERNLPGRGAGARIAPLWFPKGTKALGRGF